MDRKLEESQVKYGRQLIRNFVKYLWYKWPFTTKVKADSRIRKACLSYIKQKISKGSIHLSENPHIRVMAVYKDSNNITCFSQDILNLNDFRGEMVVMVEGKYVGQILDVESFKVLSNRLSYQILKKLVAPGVRV
jgi:hypothetical protein